MGSPYCNTRLGDDYQICTNFKDGEFTGHTPYKKSSPEQLEELEDALEQAEELVEDAIQNPLQKTTEELQDALSDLEDLIENVIERFSQT